MFRPALFLLTIAFTVTFQVATSNAQADTLGPTLSFQGRLTTPAGEPMDSNDVGITFKLYKGTNEIWTESRTVDVVDGVFNVALGQATTLDTIPINQPIDLGIKLDGELSEMNPRTTLRGTAFAFAIRGLYSFQAEDSNSNKAYNMVGGSYNNVVGPEVVGATIGGGGGVQGGVEAPHTILGDFGTIAGGARNSVGLYASTVGGGVSNNASGRRATIAGGDLNVASGQLGVVSGGYQNTASGGDATIGGGTGNMASGDATTIAGGRVDTASASFGTVGGGGKNAAHGYASTVGGGFQNKALGDTSTVSGGAGNTALAQASTVGGGRRNSANGQYSVVAGGFNNSAVNFYSTISGGSGNTTNAFYTAVAGGINNQAGASAASVGGGNTNVASGVQSTVPGGLGNEAEGDRSFAAGSYAHAANDGTFVWQDATATSATDILATYAINQFRARASGGFFFQTAAAPNLNTGAKLTSGTGTWASLSSRASKTAFQEIDTRSYLDRVASLDVMEWSYKTEDGVTHVGPMAEDFYAAFAHGPSEDAITTIDGNGVALAAIQGLYELVKEQQALLARLQTDNAQMRAAMARAGIK